MAFSLTLVRSFFSHSYPLEANEREMKKAPNEQCMPILVERYITNMNSKNGKSRVKSAHNFKCPNAFFTDKSTMDKRTISISTVHGFHLVLHIVALFGVEMQAMTESMFIIKCTNGSTASTDAKTLYNS